MTLQLNSVKVLIFVIQQPSSALFIRRMTLAVFLKIYPAKPHQNSVFGLVLCCKLHSGLHLDFLGATGPELLLMYSSYNPTSAIILISRIMVLICVIFSTPLLHYPVSKRKITSLYGVQPLLKMQQNYVQISMVIIILTGQKSSFGTVLRRCGIFLGTSFRHHGWHPYNW